MEFSYDQMKAFEDTGVSREMLGQMIQNNRQAGIKDEDIYRNLSQRADAVIMSKGGHTLEKVEQQVADEEPTLAQPQEQRLVQATDDLPVKDDIVNKDESIHENTPFLQKEVPNVVQEDADAFALQRAEIQRGKDKSWLGSFLSMAGDSASLSLLSDEKTQMMQKGIREDNPWAGGLGIVAGSLAGIPGRAVSGAGKLVRAAQEVPGRRTLGKKLLQGAAVIGTETAVGTAMLAAQDAVRAAKTSDEWRTYRVDAMRYADDFGTGVGAGALFGIAGSAYARYRRGARAALNTIGGQEVLDAAQSESRRVLQNGGTSQEARAAFNRTVMQLGDDATQKDIIRAMQADPKFRQAYNDMMATSANMVDRSAEAISRKEIRKFTDEGFDKITKTSVHNNSTVPDFDTSVNGIRTRMTFGDSTEQAMNKLNEIVTDANTMIKQNPKVAAVFKTAGRNAGGKLLENFDDSQRLIKAANVSDFSELTSNPQMQALIVQNPREAKNLASEYMSKLLRDGPDNATQVNEIKALLTREMASDIAAGRKTSLGTYKQALNADVLEGSLQGTAAGQNFRNFNNVERYVGVIEDAHGMGNRYSNATKNEFHQMLNTATNADELVAKTTGFKVGYLDAVKNYAKRGDMGSVRRMQDNLLHDKQLSDLFGGTNGLDSMIEKLKPEIEASKKIKNIVLSGMKISADDKTAQEAVAMASAVVTNSPAMFMSRMNQFLDQIRMPASQRKQLLEMSDNPNWTTFNKWVADSSKDLATRNMIEKSISYVVDDLSRMDSVAATIQQNKAQDERSGLRNSQIDEVTRPLKSIEDYMQ